MAGYLLQLQLNDLLLVGVGFVLSLHVGLLALLLGAAASTQTDKHMDVMTSDSHGDVIQGEGRDCALPLDDAVVIQFSCRRQHDGVLLLGDLPESRSGETLSHVTDDLW